MKKFLVLAAIGLMVCFLGCGGSDDGNVSNGIPSNNSNSSGVFQINSLSISNQSVDSTGKRESFTVNYDVSFSKQSFNYYTMMLYVVDKVPTASDFSNNKFKATAFFSTASNSTSIKGITTAMYVTPNNVLSGTNTVSLAGLTSGKLYLVCVEYLNSPTSETDYRYKYIELNLTTYKLTT